MIKMLSLIIKNKEFSVVGIANVAKREVIFKGMVGDIVLCKGKDFHAIRERVVRIFELNSRVDGELN